MRRLWVLGFLLSGCATVAAEAKKPPAPLGTMSIEADLTDAAKRVIHGKLTLPVQAGPLTLQFAKWMPGEHGPTGPLSDVAALVFEAGGKKLAWHRDSTEMYEVSLEIPAGAKELSVSLDFLSPIPQQDGFSAGASLTETLALLSWNQLLWFPKGINPAAQPIHAGLTVPAGWTYATALTTQKHDGAHADFADTTVETLIDSPVLAGAHVIETPLGDFDGAPMSIAVGAETDTEARLTPEQTGWLKSLVREEVALFGARHFEHYVFLLTLSDAVAHFGLEHHQSSDDRLGGRTLVEKDRASFDLGGLLAHESVHSWNGKYRRPAGLATGDYSSPMKGDLLWIYEGLTEYLGAILTARCGSGTPEVARDDWAYIAEAMRNSRGRTWRPLADTAVEAQLLYYSRSDGFARRRAVDFYYEGQLVWLEVDTILREKSGGKVSMDDFTHAFHGGKSGPPAVVPYTLEDVIKTLNTLVPNDWKAFFDKRIGEVNDDAPLDGLTRAGWKLSYAAEPGPLFKSGEKVNERLDFRSSLGIVLAPEKMTVNDVVPGKPAERAGIAPGVHLIGVNGRKISPERLEQAIADSAKRGKVELTYENADTLRTATLEYKEGLKYPRLVRIEGTPDVLSEILKAHAK